MLGKEGGELLAKRDNRISLFNLSLLLSPHLEPPLLLLLLLLHSSCRCRAFAMHSRVSDGPRKSGFISGSTREKVTVRP